MPLVIRQATEGAPGGDNEDLLYRHGSVLGVFDGVSQAPGADTGCVHGVVWYVNRLSQHLNDALEGRPNDNLSEALATAIERVRGDHGGQCDLDNPGTPAASICLVRPTQGRLEYLLLCDCILVVDDGSTASVLLDQRFERAIAAIRDENLASPMPFDSAEHAAKLQAVNRRKQLLTNTPDGYWIAAASPEAARHAITGDLDIGPSHVRSVALLTDGAARIVDPFALISWRELMDLLAHHGPEALIHAVRVAEQRDIGGSKHPRFKKHDDATAIFCSFQEIP
ncbi:hypothetical protein Rhe02_83870 [Rhizocola hellebori]|uniref:PPM-type phosphatase domain-containing protein n=1 Tax=Rhizocola hellebori TaxID=1392758 RepID=A0A8J3QG97_9ACTN|nr:protein phosphatase 2C domain-containing protein [Rhizocola hellebori]GIH10320.1 hypothetical protein Rhe02_83870 [Rhizocola hellebori]